jgi:hypothetical protein
MGQQALAVKHLPGFHDCMNFVSPASSRSGPLYGHSKRGGQLKLNGCAKGFRLCTPKFFRACENLWPMQSMIAVRYGRMWEWACELDRQDLLWFEFARPNRNRSRFARGCCRSADGRLDSWLVAYGETSVGFSAESRMRYPNACASSQNVRGDGSDTTFHRLSVPVNHSFRRQ